MIIWLYTETASPVVDGPFYAELDAMASFLWEWAGVCVWLEYHGANGWVYENAKWCGDHWLTTSRGVRPVEPIRPALLVEAP